MKGIELITKLQDGEIGSSDIIIDNIQDNDKIELIENRVYREHRAARFKTILQ